MKKTFTYTLTAAAIALCLSACNEKANASQAASQAAPTAAEFTTETDKASYLIGHDIGSNIQQMKTNGMEVNDEALLKGIRAAINGEKPVFSEAEIATIMQSYQTAQMAKMQERQAAEGKVNAEKGQAFLNENKAKEGVQTTASGLQYSVKTQGTGASPKETDTVTVHYEGKLIDGTVFDSSLQRGEPATFPLNGVIKGWTEGLQLMKEGGEYTFYIPAELAYGAEGRPGIPPNSVLIFTVQLIKVGQ